MLGFSTSIALLRPRTLGRLAMTARGARSVATLRVREDGGVDLDARQEATVLEEAPASRSGVRSIFFNRPRALHALTEPMLRALHARLYEHERDDAVHCVVLRATGEPGRAFCAGGDIRDMHDRARDARLAQADRFFRVEYTFNGALARMRTPVLSLWDGVVMGGGVGASIHGRFRVATQNTTFAMPETAIGLAPDIGATYFLPRVEPGALGVYLALTGARVRGGDTVALGLATHFVQAHQLEPLVRRLEAVDVSSYTAIDRVLREFEAPFERAFPTQTHLDVIEACFAADTVEDIVGELEQFAKGDDEHASFANEALRMLRKASPVSLKVTLESMRRGAAFESLDDCLNMEFRISVRCARQPNLVNGIKAAIIDRSKPAVWVPDALSEVTDEMVQQYFAPLDDIGVEELGLTAEHGAPQGAKEARL